jgi:hypothetical protein
VKSVACQREGSIDAAQQSTFSGSIRGVDRCGIPPAPASEAKRAGKYYDCNTMIPVPLFDLKFLIGRNRAADQSPDM